MKGLGGVACIAHLMICTIRNRADRRMATLMASLSTGTVNSHIRSMLECGRHSIDKLYHQSEMHR